MLVTAFGFFTGHAQLSGSASASAGAAAHLQNTLVAGLDDVFTAGALFGLLAFILVAVFVPARAGTPAGASAASADGAEDGSSPVVGNDRRAFPPLRAGTAGVAPARWAEAEAR